MTTKPITRIPIECPVCRANHIEPIKRQALARSDGEDTATSDIVAFRCGHGHVFVVREAEEGNHAKNRPVGNPRVGG